MSAVLPAAGPGPLFATECVRLLRDTHLPRLERAARALPEADLWWRPHAGSTSVGNLLLHLSGNVRQWIVSGLGGAADRRERSSEFAARDGAGREELLAALRATVEEASEVVASLPAGGWTTRVVIQDHQTTVMGAVLHVVEHFAWHTGQITWIAKARGGEGHGVAFHDDAALDRARNAP